jgi:hypothetical protein
LRYQVYKDEKTDALPILLGLTYSRVHRQIKIITAPGPQERHLGSSERQLGKLASLERLYGNLMCNQVKNWNQILKQFPT